MSYFPRQIQPTIRQKKLAEEGAGQGLLVVSDSQTAGKGRRGRSWESRMGEGIFYDFAPETGYCTRQCVHVDAGYGISGACRDPSGDRY